MYEGMKNIIWIKTDNNKRKLKLLYESIVISILDPKNDNKYIENRKIIDVIADLISFFIIFVGDRGFEPLTSTLSRLHSARLS